MSPRSFRLTLYRSCCARQSLNRAPQDWWATIILSGRVASQLANPAGDIDGVASMSQHYLITWAKDGMLACCNWQTGTQHPDRRGRHRFEELSS